MNSVQLQQSEQSSFAKTLFGHSTIARGSPYVKKELSGTDSLVRSLFFLIFFPIIIPLVLVELVLLPIRIMSIFICQTAFIMGIALMGTAAVTAIVASQTLPVLIVITGVAGVCCIAFSIVANKVLEDFVKPLPLLPLLDFFTD